MSKYHIYGLGAALVDTEIEVSDQDLSDLNIDKGVMTLVDQARQAELMEALSNRAAVSKRASGGSAANSIIAASYFGSSTFYSCRVADDENGKFYLNDLSEAGVAYKSSNGERQGTTGKCLVFITPDAERTMNTFLGISETLAEEDIDEQALVESEWAYIEGYLVTSETGRPAAIKLKQLADENNVKTALSLSDPAIVNFFKDGLVEMIGSGVDLLFCNEAEALQYTGCDNIELAAEALKQCAKTFAITLGAKGALLFDGAQYLNVNAQKVTAVDTNGAGDMFAGAFLYGLTQGLNFQQAGDLASKSASVVVSQFGPRLRPEQHKELLG